MGAFAMSTNAAATERLVHFAGETGVNIKGGRVRRTSSRICLGVEHGDYNGTDLFGVGTDRFTWLGYRPHSCNRVRLFSANFPEEGVVKFNLGEVPPAKSKTIASKWARFAYGVDEILRREGIKLRQGIDGIVYGNIPGGGMSRSASLTLNLILSLLDANGIELKDKFKIVELAQAVENDYVGSPCGKLDQIMILFARQGMGTHYNPKTNSVDYVPLGTPRSDFRIVILDTGTVRPGLENSTYQIRRTECEQLVQLMQEAGYDVSCLADIKDRSLFEQIITQFDDSHRDLCKRLGYIFYAQKRFYCMLSAWKAGDIKAVGQLFREDGIALRDDYQISGPELESMCDIARTVKGVLGERMLGGGDKGAAGSFVLAEGVNALKQAIDTAYPRIHPEYAKRYQIHACTLVDGVGVYDGLLD
jgi:galactokinase